MNGKEFLENFDPQIKEVGYNNYSYTPKKFLLNNVVHRRELLLAAICEYNKYNTQKDIKAVDDWLNKWDSK